MKILEDIDLQKLLFRLKDGHEPSFNTLYMAYSKPLYRKVNSIVKDNDVTDELIQDLFMKVWLKREDINPDQSFTAFLYTIAHNLVYDYLRKVSKNKRLQARLLINAVDYYMQTEEAIIGKETAQIIQNAIDKLSDQQRKVFTLCKIEGKTYQQAAQELGITVATVNSHIVKSTRFIKEYLYKNQEISVLIIATVLASLPIDKF